MKGIKFIRNAALLSGTALVLLGITAPVHAAEQVAFLGHISASVASVLNITEINALKFGNFKSDVGACDISITPQGLRNVDVGACVLLYGVNAPVAGIPAGPNETGSQAPGLFQVTLDTAGPTDVYITFSDDAGNIVDATHVGNKVDLTGPTVGMYADTFTFASDTSVQSSAGATNSTPTAPPDAVYGDHVAIEGGVTDYVRVGATLHVPAAAVTGRYTASYYIMASY